MVVGRRLPFLLGPGNFSGANCFELRGGCLPFSPPVGDPESFLGWRVRAWKLRVGDGWGSLDEDGWSDSMKIHERCLGRWNEVWKLRNADSQKNFVNGRFLELGMLQWMCVSQHSQLLDTQEQCHVRKASSEQMYFCTFSIGDRGTFQHMMVQGVYSCYPSVSWSAENPRGVWPFVLQMQFALSRSFRNLFHKLCCKYAWHSVSQYTSSWLYNFLDLHVFTHTHTNTYIYIHIHTYALDVWLL